MDQAVATGVPAVVLRGIVDLARLAPSIHNSQPWAWTGGDGTLQLWADRSRALPATDPVGRHLHVSCGTALHHAVVVAHALGLRTEVTRLPDPTTPDLLAQLSLTTAWPAGSSSALEAIRERCTDVRRFTAWPVPPERVARLARSASGPGAAAVPVLEPVDRLRVERLVERARVALLEDPAICAETTRWSNEGHDVVPPAEYRGDMSVRVSDGVVVLATAEDDPAAWLATGEALCRLWLDATLQGLSLVPLSGVVEHPPSRSDLVRQLPVHLPHPQLLVRLGWQTIGRSTLARPRRRPLDDVLQGVPA